RLAQRLWDILQSSGGVAHNRQQTVKKEGDDSGARANSKKRQRHQKRQQSERGNCLNYSGDAENNVPDGATAAGDNSQRQTDNHREKKRNAGELEVSG